MEQKTKPTQTTLLLSDDLRDMLAVLKAQMGLKSMTAVIELAVRYYYGAVIGSGKNIHRN